MCNATTDCRPNLPAEVCGSSKRSTHLGRRVCGGRGVCVCVCVCVGGGYCGRETGGKGRERNLLPFRRVSAKLRSVKCLTNHRGESADQKDKRFIINRTAPTNHPTGVTEPLLYRSSLPPNPQTRFYYVVVLEADFFLSLLLLHTLSFFCTDTKWYVCILLLTACLVNPGWALKWQSGCSFY